MKKIINKTDHPVGEMFDGFMAAYRKYYEPVPGMTAFTYKNRRKGKVSLVIGGGSGHEPMFSGFVGRGLADAAVCGNIFASPNPGSIFETAKAVDEGKGVLFVYGCYAGDNMNFDMGEEMCEFEDIRTAHVRVWDDLASAPKERTQSRRGIAGDVFVIKIAGAACDAGLDLHEVVRITEKARDRLNSVGLAISAGTCPGADAPMFELGEDEIEYGMGIHGEPGIERAKMQPADVLTERMYEELKKEMELREGQEIAVLINGLGSTTLFELYTAYYNLEKLLKKDGILVYDADVNSYCTSQDMGGFSISFLKLDEELKKYLDAPCASPYYAKGVMTDES